MGKVAGRVSSFVVSVVYSKHSRLESAKFLGQTGNLRSPSAGPTLRGMATNLMSVPKCKMRAKVQPSQMRSSQSRRGLQMLVGFWVLDNGLWMFRCQ